MMMKNFWRRAGAMLLVLALAAAMLTACGSTQDTTSAANTVEEAKETAAPAEADATATESTEPDLLDEILERGTLRIGTEGTYSPNSYHDESGELVGFDVEVAAVIAKYLGVEPEYVETEWSSIFAALDSGKIDVVVNEVGYNEERAAKYDFSTPYTFVQRAILVKGDNTDINSLEDLKGKIAANESTSLLGELALEYGAELDPVNAMAQSISEVLNGRADATLNYVTSFNDYITQHPDTNVRIIEVGDPEPTSYVPVVKGNERLMAAINDALAQAKASGELKAISEKYFGIDVTAG